MTGPEWFIGCWARTEIKAASFPSAPLRIFEGERSLWASGPLRVAGAAGWRVAICGLCVASTQDLEHLLARIAGRCEPLEALTGLGGSYHAVVDDGRTLTVLGDIAGLRQIFTAEVYGVKFFASSPGPLAAVLHAQVDEQWLAAKLLCPGAVELHERSTAFAGVSRVPPGWMLRCGRSGATPIRRSDPTPDGRTPLEAAKALGDALHAAVAARRGDYPISSDLSGGLDSTSLALLAARHGPVLALTYVDPLASGDEDVVFARAAAAGVPGISHQLVTGDTGTLPYSGIGGTDPLMLDEPSQDLLIAARARARLAPAAASAAHLVGDGGDVVLSGPLTYLADLARARRYKALAREATAWARLRQRPATSVIRAAMRCAASTYAQDVQRCAYAMEAVAGGRAPAWHRTGVEANLTWCRPSAAAGWAGAGAARQMAERLHALADERTSRLGADTMALRAVRWHGNATRGTQRLAAAWGIALHAPFLDDAVIRACAALAVTQRTTAYEAKPLLRRALAGAVPAEFLDRRSKGDYTASEYAGLRDASPTLRALLREPLLADLGLIEPRPLFAALDDAVDGRAAPLGALGDVIATELWLRAQHATDHTLWPFRSHR
jgi:asparagine synthase (glutamine-hydrolysing)